MTGEARFVIWRCPKCGAWAGSDYLGRGAPPRCKRKAGERNERTFPSCQTEMERIEVIPADEAQATVTRLREALANAQVALGYLLAASRPYLVTGRSSPHEYWALARVAREEAQTVLLATHQEDE